VKYRGAAEYVQSEQEHRKLANRLLSFRESMTGKRKKAVRAVLVTTVGLSKGKYSSDYARVATLDQLFEQV